MNTSHVLAAETTLLIPAPADLIWGSFAFIVIFGLFVWKVIPRLNVLLDERGKAIEGRIDEAKHARQEAERVLQQYQDQLADARDEGGRIREQAREDAKRIVAEARGQADAEAARIVTQAHERTELERASAAQSLRRDVGTLAIDLASSVIGQHLENDKNATALVDRFLADLDLEKAPDTSSGSVR